MINVLPGMKKLREIKQYIFFLKKRKEKEIKETKESDLTSEQQWHKNVDNIWVKIIHVTKNEWSEKT